MATTLYLLRRGRSVIQITRRPSSFPIKIPLDSDIHLQRGPLATNLRSIADCPIPRHLPGVFSRIPCIEESCGQGSPPMSLFSGTSIPRSCQEGTRGPLESGPKDG